VRKRLLVSALGTMVALMGLAGTVSAALPFANGGFENGTYPCTAGNYWCTLHEGNTDINRWEVGSGNIEWVMDAYWRAHSGDKSIDLSGTIAGSIFQDIDTIANKWYFVTFWMAGNPEGTKGEKVAEISVPGKSQQYTFDTTTTSKTSMGWVQKEFVFQATSSETRLTFTGITSSPFGAAIDEVDVTQVTYPGTDCKKDGWKSMVDNIGNAFKNQGDCVSYYATGERNLADPKDDA
jgi:choice-of-anchor C domain-containing protein